MAKVELRAGAKVDFLSEEEYSRRMKESEDFFEKLMREEEGETITRAEYFLSDSTGGTSAFDGGAAAVYRVPVGFTAVLTRLSIDYQGSNANTPTACDVRIVADVNTPASLVSVFNSVPATFSAGRSHAPIFRGGQRVAIAMTGGPHSTQMAVRYQVILTERKPLRHDTEASGAVAEHRDIAPLDRP